MKRLSRMLGVTLLEIMLVLAIAAMIIVMSIRYYQNATVAQQTNGLLQTILAVTAAADNLAQGTGTYSAATNSAVVAIVGATNVQTPWSAGTSAFTVSNGAGGSYVVKITMLPGPVCQAIVAKLAPGKPGSHFSAATCSGTTTAATNTVTYTYTATTS